MAGPGGLGERPQGQGLGLALGLRPGRLALATSLEPDQLQAMIAAIRNIESALGNGVKKPTPSEIKNLPVVRKSIVTAKSVAEGDVFSIENLTVKRPGTGVSPMQWDRYVGKAATRAYEPDELIDA